ncbi:FAD/NAD(P)-binding domain-containing protein [Mycena maculata]|uniref:FAD/NAD(P)-binding domain-containing protein n=1 Tax=Mycena maculata TaxID=230809 RepID=A0AAD7JKC7_9AGAR|nr:FAD/NAD(P)-binding domain-containing protein [Mycena maculata]
MKVAVVGSGVSGLGATWEQLLNEYSEHEVHLYEADSRPGGHANTVKFTPPGKQSKDSVYVDTGFIVFNPSTYPNFIKFLKLQGVKILPTEMTFSVSRDGGVFEWAGSNLMTIFCQPHRLIDPNMWRLIYDVLRFNACARSIITADAAAEYSIGEYLDREGYSDSFKDNYLIPMTACIWSTPPEKCALEFPARTLIQFLNNHHLLQITGKPSWLTLEDGSRVYVNKILEKLPTAQLHLSTPIKAVSTGEGNTVQVTTEGGATETYDHVIFACHSDTVLSILEAGEGVTAKEKEILGMFQWNRNEAVLHSDIKLMPQSRLAWSCWNYLTQSVVDSKGERKANSDQVSLTYGMNDLQHIPESKFGPVLVSLNPPFEPREGTLAGRYRYDHPVLDAQAVRAQKRMPAIQRIRGISYAGAYLKYGFHEDGFASGLAVAQNLLTSTEAATLPFEIDLEIDRRPASAWVAATFFMLFEASGGRSIVGYIGAWFLALAGGFLWQVFGWGGQLRAERKVKAD